MRLRERLPQAVVVWYTIQPLHQLLTSDPASVVLVRNQLLRWLCRLCRQHVRCRRPIPILEQSNYPMGGSWLNQPLCLESSII